MRVALAKPAKKERGAEYTKARIVGAAITEFSAKGFDGTRLSAVAKAANVQSALIHHYFVDKEGLFRAALEEALAPMSASVWGLLETFEKTLHAARETSRRPTPAELRQMTVGFVMLAEHLFTRHGSLLSMLRHEAERNADSVQELIGRLLRPSFEGAVRHLQEMQERGELARFDAGQLCLFVMGSVGFFSTDGALVRALAPGPDDPAARRDELVELILARVTP